MLQHFLLLPMLHHHLLHLFHKLQFHLNFLVEDLLVVYFLFLLQLDLYNKLQLHLLNLLVYR
jgi:hypothetical protein